MKPFDHILKKLATRAKKRQSKHYISSFYQDRATFARVVLDDLVKCMDALHWRSGQTYLERLYHLDRFGDKGDPDSDYHAQAAAEWQRFDREDLPGLFDEMLGDGFNPEIQGKVTRILEYVYAVWVFYQFIAPKIPLGMITEKMALAAAKITQLAAVTICTYNKVGRALPGIEARRDGKQAQAKKNEVAILDAYSKLEDVSGKSANRIVLDVLALMPEKERCTPPTALKYLKKFKKI